MNQFKLPNQSMPLERLRIPASHLARFMAKNNCKMSLHDPKQNFKNATQFTQLFKNVWEKDETHTASTTSTTFNQVSSSFSQPANDHFRMHVPQQKRVMMGLGMQRGVRVHTQEHSRRQTSLSKTRQKAMSCMQQRKETMRQLEHVNTTKLQQYTSETLSFAPLGRQYTILGSEAQPSRTSEKMLCLDQSIEKSFIKDEDKDEEQANLIYCPPIDLKVDGKQLYSRHENRYSNFCSEQRPKQQQDMINLQKHLQKTLVRLNVIEKKEEKKKEEEEMSSQCPNYMFVKDDRDRFGNHLYPLSGYHITSPGPGQYECNNTSLEYRSEKILDQLTQKNYIRQWQQAQ